MRDGSLWRRLADLFSGAKKDGQLAKTRAKRRRRASDPSRTDWRRDCLVESLEHRVVMSATPTAITLNVSAPQVIYGQDVTLTADVDAAINPAVGDVTFLDHGVALAGPVAVNAAGEATLDVSLNAGSHDITASYHDSSNTYADSSTTVQGNSRIDTVAGNGTPGYLGDGGPAAGAEISGPQAVAVDAAGDVFIADMSNNVVREINHATGIITTVAGDGTAGYLGDTGAATAAELNAPRGVAVNAAGTELFIADSPNNRVREVDLTTGVITTVAGDGTAGYVGDTGQATAAELFDPFGVALDSAGAHLYIADTSNNVIREVDLSSGIITTVAGNGTAGYFGDNGAATAAELSAPQGVAVDSSGNIFIADTSNSSIREVNASTGIISTVAGDGTAGYFGDGGPATSAELDSPTAIAVDASGNLFIADQYNSRIREVVAATGTIATVAGTGDYAYGGDGGAASSAKLNLPTGVALDSHGNLLIADTFENRIREVSVGAPLIVTAAPLTITADNQTKVYGDANPTLTASYSGFVNGDTAADLIAAPTLSTAATAASSVDGGPYSISLGGAVDPNYSITYVSGALTVTPAALTITPDNQTRDYGAANPTLTVSYNGFVNGDTAASLTTAPTLSTTATTTSSVDGGPYAISASGAVDDNYDITYATGTLTITPVALTITADNQTKVYGADVPTLTATYTGLVAGDTAASMTKAPTIYTPATAASSVSGEPYTILIGGAVDDNYTISYVNGWLDVTPATLTITADDQTKSYGDANPTLTASYSGFVNGDTSSVVTTAPTLTTTATTGSDVGSYDITASGADAGANYTITYVDGALAVTPVGLTITADDQTKVYGDALPTLTASYSGFVNGDTAASLTTAPTITTTATAASTVDGGPYTITASGAVDANYTISYAGGALTVTPAALTITADDQSKVYGADNPTLTASFTGLVNGDTSASLTTAPTLSTTATTGSSVAGGPYTISATGAVDDNYTITYVDGALTVTPAALTISADDQTKVYGDALPALTASYSGFVNGDTSASLTTAPTLATLATAASGVGAYDITVSGAVDGNYTISYVNGTLAVTPATLIVTPDDQTKVYGADLPTLTASYSGFVNGDTDSVVTTAPTLATTALASSDVGNYDITATGADAGLNYTISYQTGNLAVTPAALTITADNQTKIYGAANPTLTASYTGFVNGDTSASLTTAPAITTTATTASSVDGGPYTITASGAVDGNYTITYVDGALTVTPAALTITADNQSKIYGADNPSLTASYSGFVNDDTADSLTTAPTLSTTATTSSSVDDGPYAISVSGAVDDNYTISYANGTLTVTPAALTITADNQTKVYGADLPTLTASYSGFVNGDTSASLTTAPTLSTAATAASDVGSYDITASGADAGLNYTISYVNGSLTVTPAALTITADNQTKAYGDANPTLTASYSGFVNGDTDSVVTTAPTLATTATTSSNAGSYDITASGADAGLNYTISYVNGSLTVTPVALTITADDQSKVYGAANPTLTASYSGFVNGDTAASLTTAPTLSTTATTASSVAGGPYTITASGADAGNYTISYVGGSLTVTPAALTITADNQTKAFGTPNPTLTASYSGFVNGDTADNLTTKPTLTTTATTDSPDSGSPYPITPSGAVDSNYTISYQNGSLTIAPTATADVYVVGSGTATVAAAGGLLANDGPTGDLTVTVGAVAGASGGTFTFNADGSFSYTPGPNFAGVDQAEYTVTDGNGNTAAASVTVVSHQGAIIWKFYETMLDRIPRADEVKFWNGLLSQGISTGNIAGMFFDSDEYVDKAITNYYESYLGRAPDATGLAYWKANWRTSGGPKALEAALAASQEFYHDAGGTPETWLAAVYQRILGRAPDANDTTYWVGRLNAAETKLDVANALLNSAEAARDEVNALFQVDFGTAPNAQQLQVYTSELSSGTSEQKLVTQLADVPVYTADVPAPVAGAATAMPDYLSRNVV